MSHSICDKYYTRIIAHAFPVILWVEILFEISRSQPPAHAVTTVSNPVHQVVLTREARPRHGRSDVCCLG